MENVKDQHSLQKIEQLLNSLDRSELIAVNKMVIHRIKIIDDLYRLAMNSQFQPGQKVSWKDHDGNIHLGIVVRVNSKTISVKEEGDKEGIWKISAGLLTRI